MRDRGAQVRAVVAGLIGARARLERLVAAVPEERWGVRRQPERWSVAECIAHLNLTGQAYLPILDGALAEARALGGKPPARYRRDPVGWLLSMGTGPLPRIGKIRIGRVRTTPPFVPGGDLPRADVVAEFERLQEEQLRIAHAAEGLPLDRVLITSPFFAWLRYNVYSCLVILPRHQHRHLDQAEQVWD